MMLRSLTEQPKGLAGPQEHENAVLIAQKGAIRPLVSLVIIGNPNAQAHACAALSNIARGRENYQEAIVEAGGVVPVTSVLRAGDSQLQEQAAAAVSSISQLEASRVPFVKVGAIAPLVAIVPDVASPELAIAPSA